jgi:hypothetical protein
MAALFLLFVAHPADAATIWSGTAKGGGGRIMIQGALQLGDEKIFAVQAAQMPEGLVSLWSPGGNLYAGLMIADEVRRRGFTTYVGSGRVCASACSLIAMSGAHVIVGDRAWLGFHVAYDGDGNISAEGTAIVADYLHKQLGLTPAQVRYMTTAPPNGMQWATQRDAAALGFTWQPLYCRGIIGAFCTWRTCVAHYCLWH